MAEKQRHSSVLAPASRPAANDPEQALRAFIKASLITVMMNGIISTGEKPNRETVPSGAVNSQFAARKILDLSHLAQL